MPYLRVTSPPLTAEQRRHIATRLTDEIGHLFFNSRGAMTRDVLRERTTVHFCPYAANELFIGARTPGERNQTDVTVELSDWNMSVRRQRKVARAHACLV